MNRRGFFKRTLGTIAGAAIAPLLLRARPMPPPLPAAVHAAMTQSTLNLFNPSADVAKQYREGISIRYVRGFDFYADHQPARFDVLYGVATVRPDLAVRIAA